MCLPGLSRQLALFLFLQVTMNHNQQQAASLADQSRFYVYLRNVMFGATGGVAGLLIAYLLFCLIHLLWQEISTSISPPSPRRSSGDPIDTWAHGVVLMLLFSPFAVLGVGVGGYVGIRLSLSEKLFKREQKLKRLLKPAWNLTFHSPNRYAQASLCLGLLVCLGWGLNLTEPPDGIRGIITLSQVVLTLVGSALGIIALKHQPKSRAYVALALATVNLLALLPFLY